MFTNCIIPAYYITKKKTKSLPVAVPDKIIVSRRILDFIDRGHALSSLHPPLAALASLPNSTTPAYILYCRDESGFARNCWPLQNSIRAALLVFYHGSMGLSTKKAGWSRGIRCSFFVNCTNLPLFNSFRLDIWSLDDKIILGMVYAAPLCTDGALRFMITGV